MVAWGIYMLRTAYRYKESIIAIYKKQRGKRWLLFVSFFLLFNMMLGHRVSLLAQHEPVRHAPLVPVLPSVGNDIGSNVRLLEQIGGDLNVVHVRDNRAYVGVGRNLYILDIADQNQPKFLGKSQSLKDTIAAIEVVGTYAYVAAQTAGLQIFDVSNPASPFRVGSFNTQGYALDLFTAGHYTYIVDRDFSQAGNSGIHVLDVADPALPNKIAFYASPGEPTDVYVAGNYAYVTEGPDFDGGLRIVDITNPNTPNEVGFYNTTHIPVEVYVLGHYAYVAEDEEGLQIIDIANPALPTLAGRYNASQIRKVMVVDQYAYITDSADDLIILNVTNPVAITRESIYTDSGRIQDIYIAGQAAYLANSSLGLKVLDISAPKTPYEAGFFRTPGRAYDSQIVGNYLYTVDGSFGLNIIDIRNPSLPVMIAFYPISGSPQSLYVAANYVYVVNGLGLSIIDVTNRSSPQGIGFYDTPGWATGVYVAGNSAYVADGGSGLRIIDVTNPALPSEKGFYITTGYAYDVLTTGNIVYVADGAAGLQILNVSNPVAPSRFGFYDTLGSAIGVYVAGTLAYVADDTNGLQILDVSNLAAPTLRGTYRTPGMAKDVYVSGTIAYVADADDDAWLADNDGGLWVINVANSTAPIELGFYDMPGNVESVNFFNNIVYLASQSDGLYLLRYPDCYQLVVKFTGRGGIPTVNPSSSLSCLDEEYRPGTLITLNASPATGWRVATWQGTSNDNSTSNINQMAMPAADYAVTVNYAPICYGLGLTHTGTGNHPNVAPPNSAGCSPGQYVVGEAVTFTAAPGTGHIVGSWSGTTNDSSSASQNSLVMPASNTVVGVNYVLACYRLTLSHAGSGNDPNATPLASEGCGSVQYHYNAQISINANPAPGWQVSAWSGTTNNTLTATTNSLVMPAADYSASVIYGQIPVSDPGGDLFELDNTCSRSRPITTDGSEVQQHTFHAAGDADWIRFDVTAGARYRVEVTVPQTSPADVVLALYGDCASAPAEPTAPSFSPGARLDISRTVSGPTYVRISQMEATVAGANVTYEVSVRKLGEAPQNRALLIVAGRLKLNDAVQANIDNVAKKVYNLFQRNGYTNDNIYLLASNPDIPGYKGTATRDNLQAAITQWAASKVTNGVFTLYLVDHGTPERFYLDGVTNQQITPSELNEWLTALEQSAPGVKINVIIEACEAGSFIDLPTTISRNGRIVLTSSNASNDAKASKEGAYFSDHLLTRLQQGYNLSVSFAEARAAAKEVYSLQDAWLDGDGDGIANEFDDATAAAQRGFAYAGTLPGDEWPPHIFSVAPQAAVNNGAVLLRADVRDDARVRQVWVVIYPPDYTPPRTSQELQKEVLTTTLFTRVDNDNHWEAKIIGLQQRGVYRLLVHAEDEAGLVARPVWVEVNTGVDSTVYLPMVMK